MSELLDAMYRVGERKLRSLRKTKSYRAAMSIAAREFGKPLVDDDLPPPTSRYDAKWSLGDLSVFRTGLKPHHFLRRSTT